LIILAAITFTIPQIQAQTIGKGGAIIYTGLTNATSQDNYFTPEGTAISGYHIGLDARLFSGTMYFGGGLQYHKLTLLAKEESDFFSPTPSHNLVKARFGLGFNIHQFTNLITLRAKLYGTFNFNMQWDKELVPEDYIFTGAYAGGIGGLGIDIGFVAIDVEYEKGLVNALSMRPDSKLDIWTLSVGFFF